MWAIFLYDKKNRLKSSMNTLTFSIRANWSKLIISHIALSAFLVILLLAFFEPKPWFVEIAYWILVPGLSVFISASIFQLIRKGRPALTFTHEALLSTTPGLQFVIDYEHIQQLNFRSIPRNIQSLFDRGVHTNTLHELQELSLVLTQPTLVQPKFLWFKAKYVSQYTFIHSEFYSKKQCFYAVTLLKILKRNPPHIREQILSELNQQSFNPLKYLVPKEQEQYRQFHFFE